VQDICDPVSIALIGLTVASTGASIIGQAQAAKAQTKAYIAAQETQSEEIRKQQTTEMFDQDRAARREQARIRTASGEAGLSLSSGSVEGLLMDSVTQAEMARDRSLANAESRQLASRSETNSALSNISSPTLLGAGLQLGGAAVKAWAGSPAAAAAIQRGAE
jgi:hypothetical protein